MPITSKTGLLPALKKKNITQENQGLGILEIPNLVGPAPFMLKPFAGIYNPFPYGCSVLCNHPADFEAKSIVKRAKDAWVWGPGKRQELFAGFWKSRMKYGAYSLYEDTKFILKLQDWKFQKTEVAEGKSVIDLEEVSLLRMQEKINQAPQTIKGEKNDNVPEELFRRYTQTDSRPVTPTPTLTSIATRNLRTRRCMTPDPTSFMPAKEKTLLVLDLRRSHSQETVCWPGSINDPIFDNEMQQNESEPGSSSNRSQVQIKKKKVQKKKAGPPSATASSLKTQSSKDSESKTSTQTQHASLVASPKKGSLIQEEETIKNPEISSEESMNDINIVKRRGKKTKKGKKSGKGDKEFQGIPDPGETQVSALENNSKGSSRESPIEGEKLENQFEGNLLIRETKIEVEENKSFLSWDTLKSLQRQLDQEVIDSEFNLKRKIALEEALKYKKDLKHSQQGEEMKNLKKEYQLVIKESEKWLSIPRVFTRRSARFEIPMDSRALNSMTPMQYVQRYVFASPERLVLYNHVFNLYKEDLEDDDEEKSRTILGKHVTDALGKIMGRSMIEEEAEEFRNLLNWKDDANIDFRTFTGISATCERVMSPQFCSQMSSQKEDPRHEIEIADFVSLDEKLARLAAPDKYLVKILKLVRDV